MAKTTSLPVALDWNWTSSCLTFALAGIWSRPQDPETDPGISVYSVISKQQKDEKHKYRQRETHCFIFIRALIQLCSCSFPAKDETGALKHCFLIAVTFSHVFFLRSNRNICCKIAKSIYNVKL